MGEIIITNSGNFYFGSPEDERILILLFYESDEFPNGITVNVNGPDYGYVSAKYDNINWTGLYGGPEYGTARDVAEGRIPLSEFNPFTIESIGTYYYWGPDADPQCDEVSKEGLLNLN